LQGICLKERGGGGHPPPPGPTSPLYPRGNPKPRFPGFGIQQSQTPGSQPLFPAPATAPPTDFFIKPLPLCNCSGIALITLLPFKRIPGDTSPPRRFSHGLTSPSNKTRSMGIQTLKSPKHRCPGVPSSSRYSAWAASCVAGERWVVGERGRCITRPRPCPYDWGLLI